MTTPKDGITWTQLATVIALLTLILGGMATASVAMYTVKLDVALLKNDMYQVKGALHIPEQKAVNSDAGHEFATLPPEPTTPQVGALAWP